LEALTAIDCAILASHIGEDFPDLYDAGIHYAMPGKRRWLNVAELQVTRKGDCKDLACARAAELRVRYGEHAFAVPIPGCDPEAEDCNTIHVVVERGDGSIEDPSRLLGMGDHHVR
jgi:hypothetical protein